MTKLVVTVGFLVAFAAGLAVGRERPHVLSEPPVRQHGRGGWLAAELGLSPEQQARMNQIWSETAWRGGREREERRRQLIRERDQAIADLVRPEDKPRYDQVLKDYAEATAALEKEWRSAFQSAVEQTREILTAEQREKYEKILERHQRDRGGRDRDRGGKDRQRGGWDRESRGWGERTPRACAES